MTDPGADVRTYPHGVPCWVDTEQPEPQEAVRFYGDLFGWAFTATPLDASLDAPGTSRIATLNGRDVAAIGPAREKPVWTTYIAVTDADESAAAVTAAGGAVIGPPQDAGTAARTATCTDPGGAVFRLWQPRRRPGAQLVNAPGTWNFSHLRTDDLTTARTFYGTVFGWDYDDLPDDAGVIVQVPGYGKHLAATVDPDIYERQASAPPGFADVVGGLQPASSDEQPHWHVTFSVGDRDASAATAERLGATILSTSESPWTRLADIRDPQGAEFAISEFRLPS